MFPISKQTPYSVKYNEKAIVHSFALVFLLGFELLYYLLIVQTGVTGHFHSNLFTLTPLFVGGVLGTFLGGISWGFVSNPVHKIIIALSLQLSLSFLYPNFNFLTLFLLGLCVGTLAPLGIYIFNHKQKVEVVFALAVAYVLGTYYFDSFVDTRSEMAIVFTSISLAMSLLLIDYKVEHKHTVLNKSAFKTYAFFVLWIYLDTSLFETLLRDANLQIWSTHTYTIIPFHVLGLIAAFYTTSKKINHNVVIALLFVLSYVAAYYSALEFLSIVYPIVISYYNVIIFLTLVKIKRLSELSFMMIFIGWLASGAGLATALLRYI